VILKSQEQQEIVLQVIVLIFRHLLYGLSPIIRTVEGIFEFLILFLSHESRKVRLNLGDTP
jgi:hypothetical protein